MNEISRRTDGSEGPQVGPSVVFGPVNVFGQVWLPIETRCPPGQPEAFMKGWAMFAEIAKRHLQNGSPSRIVSDAHDTADGLKYSQDRKLISAGILFHLAAYEKARTRAMERARGILRSRAGRKSL